VIDKTRDVEATEIAEADEGVTGVAETEDDASVTEALAEVDSSPKRTERGRREWLGPLRTVKVVAVLLILLLLLSGGAAAWLYFEQYRPKQQTDPGVAREVAKAASDGTVALLSYSPESLDKDFANAKTHLSGDFLSYYNQFTEQIVAPAAKQKSLKTTAQVIGAGVSELHPDSAVVLVFIDQSTTSRDKPDPSMAASSVLVSMTRVNGKWLITKFDPV
jgi:Mce-associated membrane protein